MACLQCGCPAENLSHLGYIDITTLCGEVFGGSTWQARAVRLRQDPVDVRSYHSHNFPRNDACARTHLSLCMLKCLKLETLFMLHLHAFCHGPDVFGGWCDTEQRRLRQMCLSKDAGLGILHQRYCCKYPINLELYASRLQELLEMVEEVCA